jgi:hypothetical protein
MQVRGDPILGAASRRNSGLVRAAVFSVCRQLVIPEPSRERRQVVEVDVSSERRAGPGIHADRDRTSAPGRQHVICVVSDESPASLVANGFDFAASPHVSS